MIWVISALVVGCVLGAGCLYLGFMLGRKSSWEEINRLPPTAGFTFSEQETEPTKAVERYKKKPLIEG